MPLSSKALWLQPLHWGATKTFWVIIALISFALETGALFYQHVLDDPPCEVCIYVRVWIFALLLLSLLALALVRWPAARLVCALVGFALAVGLTQETWLIVQIEYNLGTGGSCGFAANFPDWAPLDKWLPFLFEVRGPCMATPIVAFGLSMAHGLIAASALFLVAFTLASIGALVQLLRR